MRSNTEFWVGDSTEGRTYANCVCVRQELPPLNPASRTFASLRTHDKESLPLTLLGDVASAHPQGAIAFLHLQQGSRIPLIPRMQLSGGGK